MAAVVSLINDRELKKLRGDVDNFLRFESEVQETVNSLYKKHQSGTKLAEAFLLSRIQMNTLVEPEIKDWMKMILPCHQSTSLRSHMRCACALLVSALRFAGKVHCS